MAGRITIRFHDELNDFLETGRREKRFEHEFRSPGSIKDLIESFGVPHPEIDVILVNGQSVDFQYPVQDHDQIEVYARYDSPTPAPLRHLCPPLPTPVQFVLDTHLGRLAAYLRMTGFDTLYRNDYDDPTLARIAAEEQRILLTCDRGLLMRRLVVHGYFVRCRQPRRQLLEVLDRFALFEHLAPFTRCMHCNGPLRTVRRDAVAEQLPPRVRSLHTEFRQCDDCRKIYWRGSHYQRMRQLIDRLASRPDNLLNQRTIQ